MPFVEDSLEARMAAWDRVWEYLLSPGDDDDEDDDELDLEDNFAVA